ARNAAFLDVCLQPIDNRGELLGVDRGALRRCGLLLGVQLDRLCVAKTHSEQGKRNDPGKTAHRFLPCGRAPSAQNVGWRVLQQAIVAVRARPINRTLVRDRMIVPELAMLRSWAVSHVVAVNGAARARQGGGGASSVDGPIIDAVSAPDHCTLRP